MGPPLQETRRVRCQSNGRGKPPPYRVLFSWRATTRRAHNGRRVREAAPYRVRIFVGAPFGRLRAAKGRPYGGAGSVKVTGYRGGYDPAISGKGKGKGRGLSSPAFWRLLLQLVRIAGIDCVIFIHIKPISASPVYPTNAIICVKPKIGKTIVRGISIPNN